MQQITKLTNKVQPPYWLDLLVLAILLGIFFAIFLGSYPLTTPDGGRYAEIAREMVANKDYIVPHLNGVLYFEKPVLYYWLEAFSIHLFGLSEWSMRLWQAIFGIAGCLITYTAGRRFYNRATGILACLILATSILYFLMCHLITLDVAVAVLITASLVAFLFGAFEINNFKRRMYFWLAFALAGLAVMTKGLIGIVFPCMIVGFWIMVLNGWKSLKKWYLPSSIIIFLLITLPWHILIQLKHPEFFHFYFIEQQLSRYGTMSAGRYQPIYFFFFIMFLGFFPWSSFFCQAIKHAWPTWKQRKQYKINIFLLLWFFLIFIFFSISDSKLIPYILPIFPPAAILTAHYLISFKNQKTLGIKIGFSLLSLLGILSGIALYAITFYYKEMSNVLIAHKFLTALAIVITITTLSSTIVFWKYKLKPALIVLISGIVIFLVILICAIPYINDRSVKSFAEQIIKIQKPGDEIIIYDTYYQDLPFYARQRVNVVRWTNELKFGIKHQNTKKWMIDYNTFHHRLKSNKRIFVVVHNSDYNGMTKRYPDIKFYKLNQTSENLLVSNQK
jgi:4-amino-4-deoxy-L-arabinose transferase-like glycosyltransferase